MSKLRVHCFAVSVDGFGAGPDQDLEHPMGVGSEHLHDWFRSTREFQKMIGRDGGTTGVDNDFAVRGFDGIGAWIMGRNMFGPIRGEWPDGEWKGWWGDTPPYHCDVFVLTHYPREPLAMNGGTTFYFVTDGIHAALERARKSAGELDIRLGGGAETVRQYLQAGLVDQLHIAMAPTILGSGESPFAGIDLVKLGYKPTEHVTTPGALHVVLEK
jgi:dihydrofolate reductase